jgi:tRNA 2-thiouridine synthesizing protein A
MGNVNWFGRRGTAQQHGAAPIARMTAGQRASGIMATPQPQPQPQALVTIDALGRKCPIPIIMLAEQIRDVPVGGVIAVLADDPAAYSDVPAWCQMKSHECVFRTDLPSGWSFGIRRRY